MSATRARTNVVLLGATGHVGRLLGPALQRLENSDLQVFLQFRTEPRGLDGNPFRWRIGHDDGLAELKDRIGHIDVLLNFAGSARPDTDMTDHAEIAQACLHEAARLDIPVVLMASSAAIYGAPRHGRALTESDPPRPASDYARAKLEMERTVRNWRAGSGMRTRACCLRIGNVAGADQLLRNAASGQELRLDLFGTGGPARRSYIGVETLASVLNTLWQADDLPDVLNVAAPGCVGMDELLAALDHHAWLGVPAPADAIARVCLDVRALARLHSFAEKDSTPEEMIRQWQACKVTG